jgi:hypothetical protein
MGAAKVRKEGSNTIATRHDFCALCAGIVPFVVKNQPRHIRLNFTAKVAMGAAKVRKGGSNTIVTRHDLCALCAGIVPFVVKNQLRHIG